MSASVHVGDVGTVITLTMTDESGIVVDLSQATLKEFYIRKPDGTILTKSPVFVTNGTDGKLRYAAVAGDFDATGQYQVQAYVELPSGAWHSTKDKFTVLPSLA